MTNISISVTIPNTHSVSIASPTSYGLKIRSSTHPAKFDSDHCNAIPIAKPAAQSRAINEVVWIPNIPATEMKSITLSHTEIRLLRNLATVISIFDVSNPLFTSFDTFFITQSQISNVAIPPSIFGHRVIRMLDA